VTDPQGYDTTVAVYNLDSSRESRSRPVQDRLYHLLDTRRAENLSCLRSGDVRHPPHVSCIGWSSWRSLPDNLEHQFGAGLRIDLVAKFLKSVRPDVLCLQETKCIDDAFPLKRFRPARL